MQKSRTQSGARFDPFVFGFASLIAAVVLVAIVAIPQYLSKEARFEGLREQVGEVGHLAASAVDGDLHRKLLDPANYTDALYARAVAPLVKFHSAAPHIFYVYTMADRDGVPYFILDTAKSPDLRTKHKLIASDYMERFELEEDDDGSWAKDLASGEAYVSAEFEEDEYATFLTAHVPIYDSQGRYTGFAGVDFDSGYYLAREARFRSIAFASLGAALLLALVIGYFVARYHATLQGRMRELHESSIHDSLTGLFNRRGVMEVIKKILEAHVGKSAVLLFDVNNLTTINDTAGHVAGDAVLARTAEAIRENLGENDLCGRLGDKFLVYAPSCDARNAVEKAEHILTALAEEGMLVAGAPFSVSAGISVCDGNGAEFARMHRDAEAAMQQARSDGERIGVAAPSEACRPLESDEVRYPAPRAHHAG